MFVAFQRWELSFLTLVHRMSVNIHTLSAASNVGWGAPPASPMPALSMVTESSSSFCPPLQEEAPGRIHREWTNRCSGLATPRSKACPLPAALGAVVAPSPLPIFRPSGRYGSRHGAPVDAHKSLARGDNGAPKRFSGAQIHPKSSGSCLLLSELKRKVNLHFIMFSNFQTSY